MDAGGAHPTGLRSARGQASLELLAGLPALLLSALIALQLLATGYAASIADGAAEAGALAAAAGTGPRAAALASMPGWARDRARVEMSPDTIRVSLPPLSLISPLAERLRVGSSAEVTR
jgi:hypothetical protein